MLQSRTLPPIFRSTPPPHPPPPPPPIATFYHIPRRYERSARTSMSNGAAAQATTIDEKPMRHTRGSSRTIQQPRSVSSQQQSSAPPVKEVRISSPSELSPGRIMTRKRVHSLNDEMETGSRSSGDEGMVESKNIPSAPSTGSWELSGHVCLCQPEPKVPRPRNGKSDPYCRVRCVSCIHCGSTKEASVLCSAATIDVKLN